MSEITTPRELFLHELGDILYVERALADETLPKLIGEVTDDEFRASLEQHLEQTRQARHERRECVRVARRGARGRAVSRLRGAEEGA